MTVRGLGLWLVCLLGTCAWAQEDSGQRPNVLLILCDDLRWNALGCAGHPYLKTPHIDRLAREGALFQNAFCTTSLCSPSRASILSGLYAHAHGVTNNFTDYPRDLPSFPRQLQQAGYDTAYIGKWHMGEQSDDRRPGFNDFVTHKGQGKYFDTEFRFNGGERRVVPGYYTNVVTEMAIEWLSRPREAPFLLILGHKAPHSFYFPEEKYQHTFDEVQIDYPHSAFHLEDKPHWILDRLYTWHGIYGPLFEWRTEFPDDSAAGVLDFERMVRAYWGTILSVDDSVGRLVDFLESRGQLDDTLVIFMGDNGLLEGEHGMVDKRTMHEPSIRIPLVMRFPKWIRGRGEQPVRQQVLTVDLAPTILELCQAPPLPLVHGQSMVDLVAGRTDRWRSAWFYYYNYEQQFPYTPNVRGVRTDRWKYIHYPHGDGGPDRHKAELYDLQSDPLELHNLIDDPNQQERIEELQDRLVALMRRTGIENDTMPIDEGIQSRLPDESIR